MKPGPARNRRDLLQIAALLVLVGWFCFNWYSTAAHILRYYNPLPVSDYWRVIEDLPAFETGDLSWLWRQHNEHRIIFPEIVFALDLLLFAGRQILPLAVSFFCYAATVVLLGPIFWRTADGFTHAKVQALLLGGIIAGWPLSAFVLGTPFLLQWTLLQLAVVLALTGISRFSGESGLRWLSISIACGVVATFSSANGLVLWPILLAVAGLLHAPRKHLVVLAVSALVSAGLFLVGYQRPGVPLLAALKHPIFCIGFVVSYFSMPFGVLRNPVFGIIFGVLSLTIWLACFVRIFHNRTRPVTTFQVVAFGYFAFLLLTAALTGIGRINVTDIGFSGAKPARYVTLPLLGWALLVPLASGLSVAEKWKRFTPRTILVLTAVIVAFMQIRLGRWLRTNDDYVSHQQWAALSLQNGLFDPALLGSIFPTDAFIGHYLPLIRSRHKSIFAGRAADLPGQQFRSLFPRVGRQVERGGVIRLTPVKGGLSVVGWAAKLDGGGKDTVLFVDPSGTIIGFGQHLRAGTPRELLPLAVAASETWVGFVNGSYRSTSFVTYLAEPDSGSASPMTSGTSFP